MCGDWLLPFDLIDKKIIKTCHCEGKLLSGSERGVIDGVWSKCLGKITYVCYEYDQSEFFASGSSSIIDYFNNNKDELSIINCPDLD